MLIIIKLIQIILYLIHFKSHQKTETPMITKKLRRNNNNSNPNKKHIIKNILINCQKEILDCEFVGI